MPGEPTPYYSLAADLLAAVHLAYVAFIVGGQAAILIGAAAGWRWVRGLAFRAVHLAAISLVAAEALGGLRCPLTVWERQLRAAAGATVSGESFVSRLVGALIVHDWPEWVFTALHVSFAVLVAATFVAFPPRRQAAAC
jgi:hypothetical protein